MAELILLKPLFTGTDHNDQLNKIFDIIGTPDLATLDEICEPHVSDYIQRLPTKPKQDYQKLFSSKFESESKTIVSGVSSEGIALLDRLLSFDHRIRPSSEEALSDCYFTSLHDPLTEPSAEPLIDEHEDATYSIQKWKSIIWQMIKDFRPPPWINEDKDDED